MSSESMKALLKIDPKSSNLDNIDEICDIVDKVDIEGEKEAENLQRAFVIAQAIVKNVKRKNREIKIDLQESQKEVQRSEIKIKNFEGDIERLKKELNIYKQDPKNSDARELQSEIARLESRCETYRNEVKEYENKYFQEKTEKEKIQSKIDKLEKDLSKYKRDNERFEEDIREYSRQIQTYREEKYSRAGDETGVFREKINQKNKIINELEDENSRLREENISINRLLEQNKGYLQDSAMEMNRTRDEIRKLKLFKQEFDSEVERFKKENDELRSQIESYKTQVFSYKDQDEAILKVVDDRINEFKMIIHDKEEEIKHLNGLVVELSENLNRIRVDSDKVTVSALTKAVQEKDKQIEILKKQIEEYAKEMDKSTAVINNLNKTFYENAKLYSNSSQYNASKQADQKIVFLEKMLRESETRLKETEQHSSEKEKELSEALSRMREYESGDYQLQQAVNEIKSLKSQIKVRDRDIEELTKSINKLDYTLNEILEENDELRAKLGMEPKEKLNLDEMNNLKAVRVQENRAIIHVLKHEIETLEEERNKLKQTIRKLAKQLGSKVNVASIIDEELMNEQPSKTQKTASKPAEPTNNNTNDVAKLTKDLEMFKKRNEQLQSICLEIGNQNTNLENALKEINKEMRSLNQEKSALKNASKLKEVVIKCPSLDRLLSELESSKAARASLHKYSFLNQVLSENGGGGANSVALALKSEVDFLEGQNEELRSQFKMSKNELSKCQVLLVKAQEEVDRLNSDVRLMNKNSLAKDIFQPLKLPNGMTPSSQDIISALNEYLIDTLQELDEYKKISTCAERELEALKRKYAVVRHQVSLLYKDYVEESRAWGKAKEALNENIKRLNETLEVDSVKLQEYMHLLDTLDKDENLVRQRLADGSRKMLALRTSEKQLQRKCAAYEEAEVGLVKENKKLRVEIVEMEMAVQERFGYLERFKDLANFRIMGLQRQLEESVPISKLESVNKEYNELVQKYRQLLEKEDKSQSISVSLHQTEQLNQKFQNEIEFLKKELENEKDKSHMFEENLDRMKSFQAVSFGMGPAPGRVEPDIQSLAKRLTAVEMRELNERQKADHAQRMYDEQRSVLRQLENRNLELEHNIVSINKNYLHLLKVEQELREELTQCVPKSVHDSIKSRLNELEKQEQLLKLEVSRLRELTQITLDQSASIEFINNLSRAQLDSLNLIDIQSLNDQDNDLGKLHRQLIVFQISEATAVRKLQQAQNRCKKLEAQLIRAEQKYDRENLDLYNARKEQITKIGYLRSTVQDLRHKYAGSIPLRQQEKFNEAKEKMAALRNEFVEKLNKISEEKYELEDKMAEYEMRLKELNLFKTLGSNNEKNLLDSFRKSENLKILNLKLERANRRNKDEMKFLEEVNRKNEIQIIQLEEENLRMENEYEQRQLVWEHREADLERTVEHLRKQHDMIENLALNFEEISGNMPDHSLPIASQLDQAMNIIRSHVKLLAEAKIQSDLSRKKVDELEGRVRKAENDVNVRDKVITELRLRLPASGERDTVFEKVMNLTGSQQNSGEMSNGPVRAAQATIESLQSMLKQKDVTIGKYQEMLRIARDEITDLNRLHEVEINNMLEKLNLTRETNLQKLKHDLKNAQSSNKFVETSKRQLDRLQELEEVYVDQENTIGSLHLKIKKLNIEMDTWKAKYEMLSAKSADDLERERNEQLALVERMNKEVDEYRAKMNDKEEEIVEVLAELENQKALNSKSPSAEVKSMVEKLKQQLAQKEEQQKVLSQALTNVRSEMVSMAKENLVSINEDRNQEKKMQNIIEKTSGEYQDKLNAMGEELVKAKREIKAKSKANEEMSLELEHLKSQNKLKEQKMKKLNEEVNRLKEDTKFSQPTKLSSQHSDNKAVEAESLRRQIKLLEEKLRKQQQKQAERPFEQQITPANRQRSKSPKQRDEEKETQIIIK